MSLFDLIFIGCFLGTVGYGGWIMSLLARRRWSGARRHGWRLGLALGLYLLVVVIVGVVSPRRVLPTDGTLRYDDWWLSVTKVVSADRVDSEVAPPGSRFVIVTVRVSNAARRVRQAAPAGSLVYLVDGEGRQYEVSELGQAALERRAGTQPALSTKLEVGTSFETTRVFAVPEKTMALALGHRHGDGTWFPTLLIIGEGFAKPPVIRLP